MSNTDSWKNTNIGSIARLATGTTPPSKVKTYYGGKINWFTPQDLQDNLYLYESYRKITENAIREKKARFFPKNTILVTGIGNIGRLGILKEESIANQQITGITLLTDEIDVEYLFFWLLYNRKEFLKRASKATLPIINQLKIKKIPVLYPDISEQRRIVARIKECLDRVDEIHRLRQTSAADGEKLYSHKVVETFIDSGWPQTTLKDLLAEPISNGIFKKKKDFGEGSLLCNVKDLYIDDIIHPDCLDRVRAPPQEIMKYKIEEGDILVNRSSLKKEGLGRSCMFTASSEPILFECHIMKVKLNKDKLHPYLFTVFMNSPLGLHEILKKAKTATMTTWNQGDLSSISIPLPPKKIQKSLVDELLSIKKLCRKIQYDIQKNIEQEAYLSKAILQKAFSGEL